MNKIELIRAEIERRKKTQSKRNRIGAICGAETVVDADDILAFINSLPDEPSDNSGQLNELPTSAKHSEDLENEVQRYYSDNFEYLSSDQPTLSILTNIARHFYQWPKEQDTFTHHEQNEPLDRAVTAQMEDEQVVDDYVRRGIDKIALNYARLGAQWQKEQMKPIRVVAEDVWGLPDGRVFAGKLRIVDGGCGDAILVPGFNEEFTLYKEDEK